MGRINYLRLCAVFLAVMSACSCNEREDASSRAFVYCAIGASDAVGAGASPITRGYVFLIADRIKARYPDMTLHNHGLIGACADDIISRKLQQAVADDPDLVTVWTGSNDLIDGHSPDWFEGHLRTILSELRARTHATVLVGDLFDLTVAPYLRTEPDHDVTRERINEFNRRIALVAEETGCILVRFSDYTIGDSLFSSDGFHPNNNGHELIANAFWQAIEPGL